MSPSAITGTPYLGKGPKKIWAMPMVDYMAERNGMLEQYKAGDRYFMDTAHLDLPVIQPTSFVSPTYAVPERAVEPLAAVVDWYDEDLLRKHLDGPGRDWCESHRFR